MGLFDALKKERAHGLYSKGLYCDSEKRRWEYWAKGAELGDRHCRRELAKRELERDDLTKEDMRRIVQVLDDIDFDSDLFNRGVLHEKLGEKETAFDCYLKAAQSYDPTAPELFNVGNCYRFGRGTKKDDVQAAYWYEKAVAKKSRKAMNNLGVMYWKGEGVEKNPQRALKLLTDAACAEVPFAYGNVAQMYYEGACGEKNEEEALRWAQMGIKRGNMNSQYVLAMLTKDGNVVDLDFDAAIRMLEELAEKDLDIAKEALPKVREEQKTAPEYYLREGSRNGDMAMLEKAAKLGAPGVEEAIAKVERARAQKLYKDGKEQCDPELLRRALEAGITEAGTAIERFKKTLWKKALEEKDLALMKKAAAFGSIDALYLLALDVEKHGRLLNDAEWIDKDLRNNEDPDGELLYRLQCFARYWRMHNDEKIPCVAATDYKAWLSHQDLIIRDTLTNWALRVRRRLSERDRNGEAIVYLEPLARHKDAFLLYHLALDYAIDERYEAAKKTLEEVIEITGTGGFRHDADMCEKAKEVLAHVEEDMKDL